MKHSMSTSFLAVIFMLSLYACDTTSKENKDSNSTSETEVINSKYSIASSEYEDLATNALRHIESFDFAKLEAMVSDDVEYYLPDGGEEDRTRFIGKKDFMNFWNTYQEKTGLDSWTISNIVSIPINVHDKLKYTNVEGVMTLTYFSLNLKFGEQDANIRANFGFHFNKDKKIDKLYTYYDRTPIIEAAKLNILATETE